MIRGKFARKSNESPEEIEKAIRETLAECTENDEIELCVNCEGETLYTKGTHISYRNYYIEGSGQLCEECFKEIYG